MHFSSTNRLPLNLFGTLLVCLFLCQPKASAQDKSVVLIHADKSSGYGVAYGGPNKSPDMIVTALHLVAGKKSILVKWQGKSAYATVEKIYKPSDLALLKLKTPLGIPTLGLYSGEPPWDTNINFWEIPVSATIPTKKTTILDGRSSLANISERLENEPAGLSKALCVDDGQYYPGMTTPVINFKEANIRKAHSGTPLTYGDKILGMVDGGARLVGGKPCVWAIPAADFNKLYAQGTAPAQDMASCNAPGVENKYMYSGVRSDNILLNPEEIDQALLLETPIDFSTNSGRSLNLHHNYTMSFREVYETLFDHERSWLEGLFKPGDSLTLDHLLDMSVSLYSEENTGVSIMIPADCKLTDSLDGFGVLNTTSSPGGLIELSFYISPGETMDEGIRAMDAFKAYLLSQSQNIESNRDSTIREYNKYYSEDFTRNTIDDRGGTRSIFFSNLRINDGDFMAVTLNVPEWSKVSRNPSEKLFFYLMQTCTVLSDFTIY